jgi:uncharacterized membrane protein (DUF485 family)
MNSSLSREATIIGRRAIDNNTTIHQSKRGMGYVMTMMMMMYVLLFNIVHAFSPCYLTIPQVRHINRGYLDYIIVVTNIISTATENGKAGTNGEHSMMDGMPVVGFAITLRKSPTVMFWRIAIAKPDIIK